MLGAIATPTLAPTSTSSPSSRIGGADASASSRRAVVRAAVGRAGAGQQQRELVAAEAGDRVVRAGPRRVSRVGDHVQQLVADVVAEGVVDLLEAVEVEQQQRDGSPSASSAWAVRSARSLRLGRPVSASVSACCSRSSAIAPTGRPRTAAAAAAAGTRVRLGGQHDERRQGEQRPVDDRLVREVLAQQLPPASGRP